MIRYQNMKMEKLEATIGMMLAECYEDATPIFSVLVSIYRKNSDKDEVDIALTEDEAKLLRRQFEFVASNERPAVRAGAISLYDAWSIKNQSGTPNHFEAGA
jgi:hypothetical protein